MPPSFALHLAMPILHDFRRVSPEVEINLSSPSGVGSPLDEVDAAVVYSKPMVTGLIADLLWSEHVSILCQPGHAVRHAGLSLAAFVAASEVWLIVDRLTCRAGCAAIIRRGCRSSWGSAVRRGLIAQCRHIRICPSSPSPCARSCGCSASSAVTSGARAQGRKGDGEPGVILHACATRVGTWNTSALPASQQVLTFLGPTGG